jgi:hypothetical protein
LDRRQFLQARPERLRRAAGLVRFRANPEDYHAAFVERPFLVYASNSLIIAVAFRPKFSFGAS